MTIIIKLIELLSILLSFVYTYCFHYFVCTLYVINSVAYPESWLGQWRIYWVDMGGGNNLGDCCIFSTCIY